MSPGLRFLVVIVLFSVGIGAAMIYRKPPAEVSSDDARKPEDLSLSPDPAGRINISQSLSDAPRLRDSSSRRKAAKSDLVALPTRNDLVASPPKMSSPPKFSARYNTLLHPIRPDTRDAEKPLERRLIPGGLSLKKTPAGDRDRTMIKTINPAPKHWSEHRGALGFAQATGGDVPRHRAKKPVVHLHVVRDGDSLEALSAQYLGDRSRYLEIYEDNRSLLFNPRVLPIGAEMVITMRPANRSETARIGSDVVVPISPGAIRPTPPAE